jgi:3,8-divinyl chlorophyllide a/chlorophyllide a reductase subunit X
MNAIDLTLTRDADLRAEANVEPDPVHTGPVKKETQIIAIYGKGGIGKSFTLANLSYMMAQQGKRVLLIGCDPKSDTTSLLFGGRACPTIIETSAKKKLAGEEVKIGDVCFKRDGVFAMELGGPEVGRGCGGRGIIHGFELLEKLGFHEWGFDTGHVPESDCRRFKRPSIALRREQRLFGRGIFPQARRQRWRGRHRHQQG